MKSSPSSTQAKRRYVQGARAAAAEETGKRIIESFIDRLMKGWFEDITLDEVAADAGVTVQTVVRRFGGKDGLLAEAVKVLSVQVEVRRRAPRGDLAKMGRALIADYEHMGDAVIRLLASEQRHPVLKAFVDYGRNEHREWVERALRDELDKLDGATRAKALDALVVATDVYAWKLLRRDMGRGTDAAAATMMRVVQGTLNEFAKATS